MRALPSPRTWVAAGGGISDFSGSPVEEGPQVQAPRAARALPLVAPPEGCYTSPGFPSLDITYDFDLEDYMDALRSTRNGAPGPSGIMYALLRAMPS
jgi:hypothetical protein